MKRTFLFIQICLLFVTLPAIAAGRYIVAFERANSAAEEKIRSRGGKIVHRLERYHAVAAYLSPESAEALRKTPGVKSVEPDPERHPLSQTVPYGIPMVQADLLSDADAANRKVCVIDSGYFKRHRDLQDGGVTGGTSDIGDPLKDACAHGSHVTGVIAALNNSRGVVGVLGSGEVNLHIVRVFDDSCETTFASDIIAAVQDCVQAGANVVNMSLGAPSANTIERQAMEDAYAAGTLLVAAAGNDGTHDLIYPASYDVVISVAAIDSNQKVAGFSQKNKRVELAAPGVGVLSTVPYKETNKLKIDGKVHDGNWIENAKRPSSVSGNLVDGGLCDASKNLWNEKVVLCKRGSITFNEKVTNVQDGGGIAAVIYNNESGNFFGTLGDGNSSTIPAISLDQQTGQSLLTSALGLPATVVSKFKQPASGYAMFDGTSAATPHVAGVAALIWSYNPNWTNVEIRKAMQKSAMDLGKKGRDRSYGFGLVQAEAALQWLIDNVGIP